MAAKDQTDDLLSKENVKDAAMFGAEFIPGVGEALAIKRTSDALDKKDYLGAGIEATAGLLGIIPGVGDLAGKGLRVATKKFRKADIDEAEKLIADPEKLQKWRDTIDKGGNRLPESQRQKNIPEAQQAAEDLFQGNIKSKEARKRIKDVFPEPKLYTSETMPEMPTVTDVVGSMGKKSEKGILGVRGFDLEPGQRVGARLDIPAYNEYDKWVVSIHDGKTRNGSVVGYGQAIRLKNIEFGSDPKVALDIAKGKRVAKSTGEEKPMGKATIARVFGDYVPEDPYELQMFAKKVLADKDSGWTQVGMNPYRGSYFYDKPTGNLVTSADEVIQVGPLVLAKNAVGLGMDKKPTLSEVKSVLSTPVARTKDGKLRTFNEGGAVPMKEQMEMFEDGGLMDEGGTVDPVSGNDVPPGSTQEEVRDDIPAQLSEGEFVFPADVVRYIGLGNLMRMRQEAKMGLKLMDEMGQMGNSEEATMPDDLPFDINDLDTEDEPEYNVGGFVPATPDQQQFGIAGYQQAAAPTTGFTQAQPIQAASSQVQQAYTPVAQAPVPTMRQYEPAEIPTFSDFTSGEFGSYDELREYRNEAGNVIMIPFKDGQPISPIPEGYTFVDPEAIATEEVTTTPTTPQTTSVRDTSDSDERRRQEEEEMFGPGGGRLGVAGEIYGVSFDMPEGTLPGMMGAASLLPSLLTKGQVPEGVNVNFKQDDIEFTVSGQDYNDLKKTIADFGVNSKEAKNELNEIGLGKAKTELRQRSFMAKQAEKMGEEANRQAQTEGTLQNKIAKAQQMEVGSEERSRAFGNTEDNVNPSTGFTEGSIIDTAVKEASAASAIENIQMDSGIRTEEDLGYDLNKGGLASKPKPKAKKMKRGGLASKK